jgi:hypothetical protein
MDKVKPCNFSNKICYKTVKQKNNNMKNLSMRNLKLNEEMSEETPCFSADLYENGKLIAHVSNRGYGGCNDVRPAGDLTYKDVAYLNDLDTECYIIQMAEDLNFIKKRQAKFFVLKKGMYYYTHKAPKPFAQLKKASNYKEWLQKELDNFKKEGYEVVNTNL